MTAKVLWKQRANWTVSRSSSATVRPDDERSLGCKPKLRRAVNDRTGIDLDVAGPQTGGADVGSSQATYREYLRLRRRRGKDGRRRPMGVGNRRVLPSVP